MAIIFANFREYVQVWEEFFFFNFASYACRRGWITRRYEEPEQNMPLDILSSQATISKPSDQT